MKTRGRQSCWGAGALQVTLNQYRQRTNIQVMVNNGLSRPQGPSTMAYRQTVMFQDYLSGHGLCSTRAYLRVHGSICVASKFSCGRLQWTVHSFDDIQFHIRVSDCSHIQKITQNKIIVPLSFSLSTSTAHEGQCPEIGQMGRVRK